MNSIKECMHNGQLCPMECAVQKLSRAVVQGEQFFVRGTCTECGILVEREYVPITTLPMLEAMLQANDVSAKPTNIPWDLTEDCGIPAHIYIVHPGEGLAGICGRDGMKFSGIDSRHKQLVYRCRCGFEWQVCHDDLNQLLILGMHKSMAERRHTSYSPNG